MHSTAPQEIFLNGTHGVGRQDKKPPRRFGLGLSEPLTAVADHQTANDQPQNRQTHHGSETRQTDNITGRVPLHVKNEVKRIGAMHGWTESYTVRTLVEQALAHNLGEKFAVMIRNTIQEAIKTELQKDREWLRQINLIEYMVGEQGRLTAIDILRLLLPPNQDITQKRKDIREQMVKNLPAYFHTIGVMQEQNQWPSSK
jgi:hypothetical protein